MILDIFTLWFLSTSSSAAGRGRGSAGTIPRVPMSRGSGKASGLPQFAQPGRAFKLPNPAAVSGPTVAKCPPPTLQRWLVPGRAAPWGCTTPMMATPLTGGPPQVRRCAHRSACAYTVNSSQQLPKGDSAPILQKVEGRHQQVKKLAQGHTARAGTAPQVLLLFLKLSCNPYTVTFTNVKCKIQWSSVWSRGCTTITPKRNPTPTRGRTPFLLYTPLPSRP